MSDDPVQGGELFDLGYRRYDGPRKGRNSVRLALWISGLRQAAGIGRGGRAKILPVLLLLAAAGPAAILLVIQLLLGENADVVSLGDYFNIIALLVIILAGIMAPGLLIPDRQQGVMSLYLVRPMTVMDYLAARWLAFFVLVFAVIMLGFAILILGQVLGAAEPLTELRDNWQDIPRVIAGSAIMAVFLTSLPLAVAAFTPRRAYAAAIVIGAVLVSTTIAGFFASVTCFDTSETRPMTSEERAEAVAFLEATEGPMDAPVDGVSFGVGTIEPGSTYREQVAEAVESDQVEEFTSSCQTLAGENAKWVLLGDISQAPSYVTDLLFDAEDLPPTDYRELAQGWEPYVPIGWYAFLVLGAMGLLVWRYRRVGV